MAIVGRGPRLTLPQQMSRDIAFRGMPLAAKIRTPGGNLLRAVDVIGKRLQTIEALALRIDQLHMAKLVPEMITIEAGSFIMGGTEYNDEQPIREISLSSYALGKFPVTNSEFKAFLEATGQNIPGLVANSELSRHPVVNVNCYDATAYSKWLNEATGRKFRPPTEAEWEYAARGPKGLKYPWGNEWDEAKTTFNTNGTRPVDAHPEGASPFGIMDLSGNVWEWTGDWYGNYNPKDLNDPKGPKSGDSKVLRGGSWVNYSPDDLRGASRFDYRPVSRFGVIGFRVAEDI